MPRVIGDLALEQQCWNCLDSPHVVSLRSLVGLGWSGFLYFSPTQLILTPGRSKWPGRALGRSPEAGDSLQAKGVWGQVQRKEPCSVDWPAERTWQPFARSRTQGTLVLWGWSKPSLPCLRPSPLTRAALLQLLHGHWLAWGGWVLHAAQQGLHKAGPVGRADADVVPRLVLEPLLASSVQAHQDRGPAGGEERGSYRSGRQNVGGGECWDRCAYGSLPHVDLLLCRFSTERTVAWNIFLLCTWTRPRGGGGQA